jgi:hypothetical protein
LGEYSFYAFGHQWHAGNEQYAQHYSGERKKIQYDVYGGISCGDTLGSEANHPKCGGRDTGSRDAQRIAGTAKMGGRSCRKGDQGKLNAL